MDWSGITIMPIQLRGTEYKTYIVVCLMLWNFETFFSVHERACSIIVIVYILRFAIMNRNFKKMTRYFYLDPPSWFDIAQFRRNSISNN